MVRRSSTSVNSGSNQAIASWITHIRAKRFCISSLARQRCASETLTFVVSGGDSVHIPTGVLHGFTNTGEVELQLLVIFPAPEFAPTAIRSAN